MLNKYYWCKSFAINHIVVKRKYCSIDIREDCFKVLVAQLRNQQSLQVEQTQFRRTMKTNILDTVAAPFKGVKMPFKNTSSHEVTVVKREPTPVKLMEFDSGNYWDYPEIYRKLLPLSMFEEAYDMHGEAVGFRVIGFDKFSR